MTLFECKYSSADATCCVMRAASGSGSCAARQRGERGSGRGGKCGAAAGGGSARRCGCATHPAAARVELFVERAAVGQLQHNHNALGRLVVAAAPRDGRVVQPRLDLNLRLARRARGAGGVARRSTQCGKRPQHFAPARTSRRSCGRTASSIMAALATSLSTHTAPERTCVARLPGRSAAAGT